MAKSYAKINLSLNVLNKSKPTNLHTLDMVNCSINLYDTINVHILNDNNNKIMIECNDENVPTDHNNLIYKVVEKFKKYYNLNFSIKIKLIKNIPACSGLGGGSSNAATILKILNNHFKKKMDYLAQRNFLNSITSDGAYMVNGGFARVRDTGTKIDLIDSKFHANIFVVKPKSGCLTKDVYNNLDYKNMPHSNNNKLIEALENNNFSLIAKNIANSLMDSACKLNKDILDILTRMRSCGFEIVSLTGSGSACFAISEKSLPYKQAKQIFNKNDYDICGVYKTIKTIF